MTTDKPAAPCSICKCPEWVGVWCNCLCHQKGAITK